MGSILGRLQHVDLREAWTHEAADFNKPGCDFSDRERWPEYIEWHVEMTLRFKKCFGPRIAAMVNSVPIDELAVATDDEDDDSKI